MDWVWTEKVDGTNIRLGWEPNCSPSEAVAYIGGRTDNAQIPAFLLDRLVTLLTDRNDLFASTFPDAAWVTLYGEGYGAKIQKGGGDYIPDGVDFVLFDVKVTTNNLSQWWLLPEDVAGVGASLGLDVVRTVATCPIDEAIRLVRWRGFESNWKNVDQPEGLVGRPAAGLLDRSGRRITTKLKWKDLKPV